MTPPDSMAEFTRQGVPRDAALLLRREAATLDELAARGLISEATARRQVVRFARWLSRRRP